MVRKKSEWKAGDIPIIVSNPDGFTNDGTGVYEVCMSKKGLALFDSVFKKYWKKRGESRERMGE